MMTEPASSHDEQLRREALAWLTRVALREASASDMKALRKWRDTSPAHAAALARAGRLWRGVEAASASLVREGAVSLPVSQPHPAGLSRRGFLGAGMAAAAAGAAFAVIQPPFHLWPSLAELNADYRTATGEQRHITLADSIAIEMNTQTSIATRMSDSEIDLIAGEVVVTVGLDGQQQFAVSAGSGTVTAQRGAFNLRREATIVNLMCIDGRVSVTCENQTIQLKSGEQASYDARGLSEISAAAPDTVAWRDGMLVFRDAPLARVIDEVNRYRSGRIILIDKALGTRSVNARFEINRLDTVMSQIRHVFKAPVKTLPGGIVLVG